MQEVIAKLTKDEAFILGILSAITGNKGKPVKVQMADIVSISAFSQIHLIQTLRGLQSADLCVVMFFDDEICVQLLILV